MSQSAVLIVDTNTSLFYGKKIHGGFGEPYLFVVYDLEGKNILNMLSELTTT